MTLRGLLITLLLGVVCSFGMVSVFTVHEGEVALVLRLGQLRTEQGSLVPKVYAPGWHGKLPGLDRVVLFDTRLQHYRTPESKPLVLATREQTFWVLSYEATWLITDPVLFYTRLGSKTKFAVQHVIEPQLNDIIRTEFGNRTSLQVLSKDHADLLAAINNQAASLGKAQGIAVTDVQVLTMILPKEMLNAVYKRMAAERSQTAEEKRAEGTQQAEQIRAMADQKATEIKTDALQQAAKLRAEGDAEAAALYAKAYAKDPQFYAYYRRLGMYVSSFQDSKDWLILKPMGGLLQDLQTGGTGK